MQLIQSEIFCKEDQNLPAAYVLGQFSDYPILFNTLYTFAQFQGVKY